MTFNEIVDELQSRLNLVSTDAETRIGKAVNRLYKRITSSLGVNLTRNVYGNSQAVGIGTATVTFSGVEKVHRVYTDISGVVREIKELPILRMREIVPKASDTAQFWATQNHTATSVTVRLDILPLTAFNLKCDGTTTVSTLATTDVPLIPESFHDVLIAGVLVEEYQKMDKIQMARDAKGEFEQRLSELRYHFAKNAYQDIYSGVAQDSPFSTGGGSGGPGGGFDESLYVRLDGRGGGQLVHGGSAAGDDLTLESTTNATKGTVISNDTFEAPEVIITIPDETLAGLGVLGDTSTELQAPPVIVSGYSPSIAFIDKDSVRDWHIGIDDNDSDAFVIGRGFGPGDALTPTIRIDKTTERVLLNFGQLGFPTAQNASSDANTLDDYEEGNWTPTFTGSGGSSGQVYSTQLGRYVKTGKSVQAWCSVALSTLGTITTNAQIGGLPFTSQSSVNGAGTPAFFTGMTTSIVNLGAIVELSDTKATLRAQTAASTSFGLLAQADLSNTTHMIFYFAYEAAA